MFDKSTWTATRGKDPNAISADQRSVRPQSDLDSVGVWISQWVPYKIPPFISRKNGRCHWRLASRDVHKESSKAQRRARKTARYKQKNMNSEGKKQKLDELMPKMLNRCRCMWYSTKSQVIFKGFWERRWGTYWLEKSKRISKSLTSWSHSLKRTRLQLVKFSLKGIRSKHIELNQRKNEMTKSKRKRKLWMSSKNSSRKPIPRFRSRSERLQSSRSK